MSARRRILKYLLWIFALGTMGALWGFSQLFFSPWEDDYEGDVASLIPRDVDFYVAKADLRKDFDPFPQLAFYGEFEASPAGRALRGTEAYRGLFGDIALEEPLAELETALAQLPIEVQPLSVFGGRDLALAGYFAGSSLATSDWAVYGRMNWMGKLGYGIVHHGWANLAAQGIQSVPLEHEGETIGFTLSGGQLTRPLHLTRIRDVLIAASRPDLAQAAHTLLAAGGENSLLLSAKYGDHIGLRERDGDELEVYLDYRALSEGLRVPGSWPDPRSEDLGTALAGKYFQLGALRELVGTIGFGNNLHIELTAELSSNVLTQTQKRLYRERGFERDDALEVAKYVPADAGLFVYGHADVGDLLRQLVLSMDSDTLSLIEDQARAVWGYADIYPLIEDFERGLRDRFAFCVRDYDYPDDPQEPPRDAVPVPAWALILWVEDAETVDSIRQQVQAHQAEFGLRGREPGVAGVYHNQPAGGALLTEYWNPLIPGTGHLATLEDQGRSRYLILSNENRLLGQMFETYHSGVPPRLSEDPVYRTWVGAGLANANFLVWWNPRAISRTLRRMARFASQLNLLDAIDWDVERPRIEREVLRTNFPGEVWGAISPAKQAEYDRLVQEALDAFQAEYEARHAAGAGAASTQAIDAMEITSGALLQLATDQKRLQLSGRIGVDFDSAMVPGTGLEPARE